MLIRGNNVGVPANTWGTFRKATDLIQLGGSPPGLARLRGAAPDSARRLLQAESLAHHLIIVPEASSFLNIPLRYH